MKAATLTRRDLESLASYFTMSHKQLPKLPFLERVFAVVTKFLNARGYELIPPELRIAEARMLDAKLHSQYLTALRQTVVAPPNSTFEQVVMLVVMASPEDREKALTKVYNDQQSKRLNPAK